MRELGLGNPYSHKPSKSTRWVVTSLEESISQYRKWLYKLLQAYLNRQTKQLEDWEILYLKKVLKLAKQIKSGEINGLMCWCLDFPDYNPGSAKEYNCHAQVLYAAILWLEGQTRKPKS